jgi:hypothetical protein
MIHMSHPLRTPVTLGFGTDRIKFHPGIGYSAFWHESARYYAEYHNTIFPVCFQDT